MKPLFFALFLSISTISFSQQAASTNHINILEQQTDVNITIPMIGQFDIKSCSIQSELGLKPMTNFTVVKTNGEIRFYFNETKHLTTKKRKSNRK